MLPEPAHVMANSRHRHALEQQVPINPLECQLAEVVQPRFAQERKRTDPRQRILSFNRLHVVIEIEQERLAVTGLDEAVGMTIELRLERLALNVMKDVLGKHLCLKMRD